MLSFDQVLDLVVACDEEEVNKQVYGHSSDFEQLSDSSESDLDDAEAMVDAPVIRNVSRGARGNGGVNAHWTSGCSGHRGSVHGGWVIMLLAVWIWNLHKMTNLAQSISRAV